jgi:hypothetical protein
MHEIFISYRRVDTENLAGPLFRDLSKNFGKNSVFMDTGPGGIPWGAQWQKELALALERCEALLALIGPQWLSCTRADGRRRLVFDDDWVRREIARALERDILVIPVLFKGATPPREQDLPPDLQALAGRQWNAQPITMLSWEADLETLIGELSKCKALKDLYDLTTAKTGIRLLEELIGTNTTLRDAVVRSQDEIKRTDREIAELKVLKDVHDALHTIEHECLMPLRTDVSDARLLRAQIDFATPSLVIRDAAYDYQQSFPLLGVLVFRLEEAAKKFEAALGGGNVARDALIDEIAIIISQFPDQIDDLIATAATRLRLDGLTELMATVRRALPPTAAQDPELKPLLRLIDALDGLRDRLHHLVAEHGLLQSLDLTLRFACGAMGTARIGRAGKPSEVALEWQRIKTARARLAPPFSPELGKAGIGLLEPLESRLQSVVDIGEDAASIQFFDAYFEAVGSVFWTFDSKLKEICTEIDLSSKPLKDILSQTEARHD